LQAARGGIGVREDNYNCTKSQSKIAVCVDGYIRLTLAAFRAVRLAHLLSGLDADDLRHGGVGASSSSVRGYTEWISPTTPTVTVGWDWYLAWSEGRVAFRRLGAPRSNVMLIDSARRDCGELNTSVQLGNAVDDFDWQHTVAARVGVWSE
jgi:hypothetical protein